MTQLSVIDKDVSETWNTLPYAQQCAKQMSAKGKIAYIFRNRGYDNYNVRNYRKTAYYWEVFVSEYRNGKIFHPSKG